ncbi:MAG: hypothetical protein PHD43_10585 [Methylococcales bacterium]|nr:hypothetical protein [Methylococcales bacterium]
MEILIAIAHILGSIIAVIVFGFLVMLVAAWESERNQKRVLEETSVSLGVKVKDLNNEELAPKILQLSSERFSSELLRNRLSDFCGLIRTIWGWLGSLSQVLVLVAVIWYTITDSSENAVYAWFVVGMSISFWVVSVVFSLICKLFTGRYPGEAKQARKVAADWLKNQGSETT